MARQKEKKKKKRIGQDTGQASKSHSKTADLPIFKMAFKRNSVMTVL